VLTCRFAAPRHSFVLRYCNALQRDWHPPDDARTAWRNAFKRNCKTPCYLDPGDVRRFLAALPSVHRGDESTLLFSAKGVVVTFNQRPMGDITDLHFAEVMLGTFIGVEPPTPRLKSERLGLRD
jgi:hypothetical protein